MSRIPFSVLKANGPLSTRRLSKYPFLGFKTDFNAPASSRGFQCIRSSDVAINKSVSPKYIQYFPLIFVATILDPICVATIAPDLLQVFLCLPCKTGPYFVHSFKFSDVAIINRATVPSYAV